MLLETLFLDHHPDRRALVRGKLASGWHAQGPNNLSTTFQDGPAGPIANRDTPCREHLLELVDLATSPWAIGVAGPPVS